MFIKGLPGLMVLVVTLAHILSGSVMWLWIGTLRGFCEVRIRVDTRAVMLEGPWPLVVGSRKGCK